MRAKHHGILGNFYKKKYIFKTTCYVWSRKAGTSTLANGEMLDLGPLGRPKLKPKKVEEQFRWTMGPWHHVTPQLWPTRRPRHSSMEQVYHGSKTPCNSITMQRLRHSSSPRDHNTFKQVDIRHRGWMPYSMSSRWCQVPENRRLRHS